MKTRNKKLQEEATTSRRPNSDVKKPDNASSVPQKRMAKEREEQLKILNITSLNKRDTGLRRTQSAVTLNEASVNLGEKLVIKRSDSSESLSETITANPTNISSNLNEVLVKVEKIEPIDFDTGLVPLPLCDSSSSSDHASLIRGTRKKQSPSGSFPSEASSNSPDKRSFLNNIPLTNTTEKPETNQNDNPEMLCPVLKEVYDDLDRTRETKSLKIRYESKTVEKIWNDFVDSQCVNDSMRFQEIFLSSVSLLRVGVEKAWLNRREKRMEALSRRALGRLRPNPRRSKYFADMVPTKRKQRQLLKKVDGQLLQSISTRSTPTRRIQKSIISTVRSASKAVARSRQCAVNAVRKAKGQHLTRSASGSVASSDSFSVKTITRSAASKSRPQRSVVQALRSGVPSYISKRFCYSDEKTSKRKDESSTSSPVPMPFKRKRKIVDKLNNEDHSDAIQSSKSAKKQKVDDVSSSNKSTPVKIDRREPMLILEKSKSTDDFRKERKKPRHSPKMNDEYTSKADQLLTDELLFSGQIPMSTLRRRVDKDTLKKWKMQARIRKEEVSILKTNTEGSWPPKNRQLSVLDRLILGLDCKLLSGQDNKSVILRGLSKPDFDCLRERIRKSGYFFGFIQYYPEEENPNGRDEYDCCITSDENRRNQRPQIDSRDSPQRRSIDNDSSPGHSSQQHRMGASSSGRKSPPRHSSQQHRVGAALTGRKSPPPHLRLSPRHTTQDNKMGSFAEAHSSSFPSSSYLAAHKLAKRARNAHLSPEAISGGDRHSVTSSSNGHSYSHKVSRSSEFQSRSPSPEPDYVSPIKDIDTLTASPIVSRRPAAIIEEETHIYRRQSPKKHIRKVYTCNTTLPKILNRGKRPNTGPPGSSYSSVTSTALLSTRLPEPPLSSGPKIFSVAHSTPVSSTAISFPSSSSVSVVTQPLTVSSGLSVAPTVVTPSKAITSSVSSSGFKSVQVSPSTSVAQSLVRSSMGLVTTPTTSVSQGSMRLDSQEFWRLKGVEQTQIMEKHLLTPATAMTASEIMKLKKIEAETARHVSEYMPGTSRNISKLFKSNNPVSLGSTCKQIIPTGMSFVDSGVAKLPSFSESIHQPQLEIDEEETDDDFEFPSALLPSGQHPSYKNQQKCDDSSSVLQSGSSKRRVIHRFHQPFRKILPKSELASGQTLVSPATSPGLPITTSSVHIVGIVQPGLNRSSTALQQGRPMVPPASAYTKSVILPDEAGKHNQGLAQLSASGSSESVSTGTPSPSTLDSEPSRSSTQLLKTLLESDRDVSSSSGACPTSNVHNSWTGHQSRGTWQVNKPRPSNAFADSAIRLKVASNIMSQGILDPQSGSQRAISIGSNRPQMIQMVRPETTVKLFAKSNATITRSRAIPDSETKTTTLASKATPK